MNVVAYGGGLNSTAMIIGMHRKNIPVDLIIFADTGGEQPHTYDFIATFSQWLEHHNLPRIITVFCTDKYGRRISLEEECLRRRSLPSIAFGFKTCSQKYKLRPTDKFLNHHAECKKLWASGGKYVKCVGYDAGESRRVQHGEAANDSSKKYDNRYLLHEWGWTRDDCMRIVEEEGLPFPGKSSCFFCPSMKKAEIEQLYMEYPDYYARAIAMEDKALPNLQTVKGLGRSWSWQEYIATWLAIREFEDSQMKLAGFEDSPGCLCGMPCGCYDG